MGEGSTAIPGDPPDASSPRCTERMRTESSPVDAVRLLTLPEVAALTRVPVATLRYWRAIGSGPRSFRLGRHVVYQAADVEAWIVEAYNSEAPAASSSAGGTARATR